MFDGLIEFLYRLLYYAEIFFCMAIGWMQQLFDVFTGTEKVQYGNSKNFLINLFFSNSTITGVYLGMAAIGIVLAFIFAVIAAVRKMLDIDDKMKGSIGQILNNLFKSIMLIISLNLGMMLMLLSTNELMQSIVYAFDHGTDLAKGESHIDFTDEQFAAMARILNTIGNYSLNPSYKSRYNLNACYNKIRGDLGYLNSTNFFDYYYETKRNGEIVETWQSVMQKLVTAGNYNEDVPLDYYDDSIANAISDCMNLLKTDYSLAALQSYDRIETIDDTNIGMDRVLFLIGTMGNGNTAAAKNPVYNEEPSFTDNVRRPYYVGTKSIYDIDSVIEDFDISIMKTNYLLVYVAGVALVSSMALIIVTCVVRIFNLMFLYLIAPPIIAIMPLDDGGKLRQWMTAFIVQAFSVFATVISMRVFLIFIPIIMNPDLVLVSNPLINYIGKLVMLYAGVEAISKANGLLTGILADQAGYQSITAGDMSGYLGNSMGGRIGAAITGAIASIPEGAIRKAPKAGLKGGLYLGGTAAALGGGAAAIGVGGAALAAGGTMYGLGKGAMWAGRKAFGKSPGTPDHSGGEGQGNHGGVDGGDDGGQERLPRKTDLLAGINSAGGGNHLPAEGNHLPNPEREFGENPPAGNQMRAEVPNPPAGNQVRAEVQNPPAGNQVNAEVQNPPAGNLAQANHNEVPREQRQFENVGAGDLANNNGADRNDHEADQADHKGGPNDVKGNLRERYSVPKPMRGEFEEFAKTGNDNNRMTVNH